MASTTGQWIFEHTMALIDELNDAGEADHTDTTEYKNKTLPILNILQGELYPYSDTYKQRNGSKRPVLYPLESLEDYINLDDYICQTVLPYGLASHLLVDENPTMAAFFQQRYEELKAGLRNGIPGMSQDIVDVYAGDGGGYYDAEGNWIPAYGNGIGFEWTTRW
jgi:hypothetical protein